MHSAPRRFYVYICVCVSGCMYVCKCGGECVFDFLCSLFFLFFIFLSYLVPNFERGERVLKLIEGEKRTKWEKEGGEKN